MNQYDIKYINLNNGERLAYREIGDSSKILLLIHGNMSSSVHYSPMIERLKEDYKIYAVDLRGFGESSYRNRIDSLKDFSEDVYDFITKLNLKEFSIAGWSTGGGVAMQFIADHPGYAEKLILIESVSYMGYPIYKKDSTGQMLLGNVYETREDMAKDPVQVAPAAAAMESKDFAFMNMLWNMAIYTNCKPAAEDNEIYINESLKQRNLVDVDWALACFNMSDRHNGYTQGSGDIHKIDIPVLSFWGEMDAVVLFDMVKDTAEAIGTNAKMIVLKDSGHSPLVDCPDLLAAEIIRFIG